MTVASQPQPETPEAHSPSDSSRRLSWVSPSHISEVPTTASLRPTNQTAASRVGWRTAAQRRLMESLLAAEVPEEDRSAATKPFQLGFRKQETFGMHCGDDNVRRRNEELQAQLLEQTKAANAEHDRQRLHKAAHRRRLLRSTLLLRMKDNFATAVLVKEPHAVRRLRQYMASAKSAAETDLSATAMSKALSTLSHIGVPPPSQRPKVRIASHESEAAAAAAAGLSPETYELLKRGLRVVDEFELEAAHGKPAPACLWDLESLQLPKATDTVVLDASHDAPPLRPLCLHTAIKKRQGGARTNGVQQAPRRNPPLAASRQAASSAMSNTTTSNVLTSIPVRSGGRLACIREPPTLSGEDVQRDLAAFEARLVEMESSRVPLRRRTLKAPVCSTSTSSTAT
eukprot:GGOE01003894.1.p1 GENE.GGOE01003894.1~~GGOE01003894.1.p1  ORF type:complete len:399 (+),score=72.05 GGOE01003894.1:113-1309(+)